MRGIIWGNTFKVTIPILDRIKRNYLFQGHEIIKEVKTSDTHWVIFSNGDYWEAVSATANRRGKRANVSYIDANIDPQVIDEVIRPATVALPYHAINYFYPREDE